MVVALLPPLLQASRRSRTSSRQLLAGKGCGGQRPSLQYACPHIFCLGQVCSLPRPAIGRCSLSRPWRHDSNVCSAVACHQCPCLPTPFHSSFPSTHSSHSQHPAAHFPLHESSSQRILTSSILVHIHHVYLHRRLLAQLFLPLHCLLLLLLPLLLLRHHPLVQLVDMAKTGGGGSGGIEVSANILASVKPLLSEAGADTHTLSLAVSVLEALACSAPPAPADEAATGRGEGVVSMVVQEMVETASAPSTHNRVLQR